MADRNVGELLREAPAPDEDAARERAWRVVEAAFGQRAAADARQRSRLRAWRPAVAAALALSLVVAAFTPAGEAVGKWIADVVRPARAPSAPYPER